MIKIVNKSHMMRAWGIYMWQCMQYIMGNVFLDCERAHSILFNQLIKQVLQYQVVKIENPYNDQTFVKVKGQFLKVKFWVRVSYFIKLFTTYLSFFLDLTKIPDMIGMTVHILMICECQIIFQAKNSIFNLQIGNSNSVQIQSVSLT